MILGLECLLTEKFRSDMLWAPGMYLQPLFFLIKKLSWTEMHIFYSCVRLFILLLEELLCRATGHVYLERWKKKEAVSRLVCDLIYTYSDALLNEEWNSLAR